MFANAGSSEAVPALTTQGLPPKQFESPPDSLLRFPRVVLFTVDIGVVF
jgi:hypothetical protein